MLKKKNKELSVERITDKEEVKMMANDIDYACVNLSSEQRLEIAKVLAILGYGKLNKEKTGNWVVSERGCVITCSNCKERVELYWPDGTEIGPTLPYCPFCGTKIASSAEVKDVDKKLGRTVMKIWLDDIRPAPIDYIWLKSVDEAKTWILNCERKYTEKHIKEDIFDTSLLARYWDMSCDTSDYIELLNWLESTNRINFTFKLHGTNIVGVENMRRIIKRNGWTEVK